MKKVFVLAVGTLLLMSSCGTYTGEGAYVGGHFGSILGSAIGGLSGGPRGSDIGTIVGLAGGAVVGAAIGNAADQKEEERIAQYREARSQQYSSNQSSNYIVRPSGTSSSYGNSYADNGYSNSYAGNDGGTVYYDATSSGDDRVDFGLSGPKGSTAPSGQSGATAGYGSAAQAAATHSTRPAIEIRNVQIEDASGDGVLQRGEECKVVFEVMNHSSRTLHDLQPLVLVQEATQSKHVHVSQNVIVKSVEPHHGIRYTAIVQADNRLKDGQVVVQVAVAQNDRVLSSLTQEFVIPTSRR